MNDIDRPAGNRDLDTSPRVTGDHVLAGGVTRRGMLGAAVAISGASLVSLTRSGQVHALPIGHDQLLDPPDADLTYITLDAFAFDVAETSPAAYGLYQDATGMEPQPTGTYINAPLPIPIGSVVKQINVGYQGQPIISIAERPLGGMIANITGPTSLAGGGGPKTETLDVSATLSAGSSYSIRAFCSAGDSVLGMTIGYAPPAVSAPPTPTPTPAFVPFTGTDPRVLDTRPDGRLGAEQEIVVDLSGHVETGATAAVLNVTAVAASGRGYLAVFREGITWPGNASVNFSTSGADVGNGVITGMTDGKIRIRTGPVTSHVVVDVIGSLF